MICATTSDFQLEFRAPDVPVAGAIKFAIGRCVEGGVLVVRSRIGICAIFLGDDAEGLQEQLREAFPSHLLEEASDELRRDLGAASGYRWGLERKQSLLQREGV